MDEAGPTGDGQPHLEALRVSKSYPGGVLALDRVSLEVRRGETLALVGESGCGKTTLLRLFNRMVEPTRGSVRMAGEEIRSKDVAALRRSLGYVQQDGGLIPHWTVERNVELVPELLGWSEHERRHRVREAMAVVRLEPRRFAKRYPVELSGGQRQRVALARALAADPAIILLDEPLGALDALTRLELQRELLELKQNLRKTLVLVTHDLAEAWTLADRLAVLREGRLLQVGTPSELEARPADSYVERLLSLRPLHRLEGAVP